MAIKPVSEKVRQRLQERAAPFLDPDERVERGFVGRPYSLAGYIRSLLPYSRASLEITLTNRHLYIFELGGNGLVKARTPARVLSRYPRESLTATYRKFPPALIVGEEQFSTREVISALAIADALGNPGAAREPATSSAAGT